MPRSLRIEFPGAFYHVPHPRRRSVPQRILDDESYKTISPGSIELPGGPTSFEFKGVGQGWKPIQLLRNCFWDEGR
jgi:hypothetical protein